MTSKLSLFRAARNLARGLAIAVVLTSPAIAQHEAESLSASFRKAAQRVGPAVVGIRPIDPGRPLVTVPLPSVGPFRPGDFVPRVALPGAELEELPAGSGLLIDADRGQVVTTEQVLRGSSQAAVVFSDGSERLTSQIRRDPRVDLALLFVDVKGLNLTSAPWGDSNALEPGDWVLALGQPGGSTPSMSAGIYSARRQGLGAFPGDEWLETDTRSNPANWGGPLINLKGEVIGINTAFTPRGGGPAASHYVIRAARARRIASDLAEFGQVRRAFLGVQIEPAQPLPGRPPGAGLVTISAVTAGTPAALAGLRAGDRIKSVNGRSMSGVGMLQSVIESAPIGEELTLQIDRDGAQAEVKVRPQAQPVPGVLPGGPGSQILPRFRRDRARSPIRSRDGAEPPDAKPRTDTPQ
jgi:serine protease Do